MSWYSGSQLAPRAVGAHPEPALHLRDVGLEVVVGDLDAARAAGGAGGELQQAVPGGCTAVQLDLAVALDVELGRRAAEPRVRDGMRQRLGQVGVGDDQRRVGGLEDLGHVAHVALGVAQEDRQGQRARRVAGHEGAEEGGHELRSGGQRDRDRARVTGALGFDLLRRLGHQPGEPRIVPVAPAAVVGGEVESPIGRRLLEPVEQPGPRQMPRDRGGPDWGECRLQSLLHFADPEHSGAVSGTRVSAVRVRTEIRRDGSRLA